MQKTDIDLITHEASSGPLDYLWYMSCSEHVALDKSMPIEDLPGKTIRVSLKNGSIFAVHNAFLNSCLLQRPKFCQKRSESSICYQNSTIFFANNFGGYPNLNVVVKVTLIVLPGTSSYVFVFIQSRVYVCTRTN